jgi:hypothetical protein
MSNAKSPVEGLKASEAKKGRLGARPPIPYVPLTDLIEKREGEQIKVKMQDGTNFSMAAFVSGTSEDYLVHVIAVLRIIQKKGLPKKSSLPSWRSLQSGRKWRPICKFWPTRPRKPRDSAWLPWSSTKAYSRQKEARPLL